jgi:tetratricopeptide (TPR) repeat protein
MDLFSGERSAPSDKPTTSAASKVERAVEEAIALRQSGALEDAVARAQAALGWLDGSGVRRELRVAVPRELGFAQLVLGRATEAREALLLALEQAAHDPALSDSVRAGLATCELMVGAPARARQMLDARGRNRRAALSALARIHLYEGDPLAAEQALQEADQAPGGTTASGILLPPATVIRCFASVWGGRPDQARMLYDGVSTRESPFWELVRVALLRALWVQTGDGRYLSLAIATAEQLRFGEPPVGVPGLMLAVTAQHAACLVLTGELALAVEAADAALHELTSNDGLVLPEWPRAAMVADLALVYRDAGQPERHRETLALWDAVAWANWAERMPLVSGTRAKTALASDEPRPIEDVGPSSFESLAVRLLEDPKNARLMALRAIGAHAMALGVEWFNREGHSLGRIGARPLLPPGQHAGLADGVARLLLPNDEYIQVYKATADALRTLDRTALDGLARIVTVREDEATKVAALQDELLTAEAARRLAEERLEQVRRPGTDRGHGGRFPTVIGRSDRIRGVLDRLGALARVDTHVLLEGLPGTGRRHLAQALFLCDSDDPTGSVRAPSLECGLIPAGDQLPALDRLEKLANPAGFAILTNPADLVPEAASWLLERLAAPRPQGVRWVIVQDLRDQRETAMALRLAVESHVRIPGLDERLEDLPLLVDYFAREVGKRPDDVSTAARALLARKAYPGHLAELRATLRAAAGRAGQGLIQPEHFERPTTHARPLDGEDPLVLGLREATRAFQKDLLERALTATTGNLGRASDLLGMPKAQLVKLARELEVGLEDE